MDLRCCIMPHRHTQADWLVNASARRTLVQAKPECWQWSHVQVLGARSVDAMRRRGWLHHPSLKGWKQADNVRCGLEHTWWRMSSVSTTEVIFGSLMESR